MPFTYREVKDLYDILADAGATTKSLPEWSSEMAGVTGSDVYDAGLNDNFIKRSSVGLDRMLEAIPGATEFGRSIGGGIGSLFGMEQQGREIGATLPRQAVNMLPLVAGPWGLPATAALTGADAYTQSGSPAAGLIAGATAAFMPGTARFAEQGALSFLRNRGLNAGLDEASALLPRLVEGRNATTWGLNRLGMPVPTTTEKVSELFGRTLSQKAIAESSGQLAALGLDAGGTVAQDVFDGNGLQNPFTKEFLLGELVGQVPFSAGHLVGRAFGQSKSRADMLEAAVAKTEKSIALNEARTRADEQAELAKPAKLPEPREADPKTMDYYAILERFGVEREQIKNNPTTENVEKLKEITAQEDAALQKLVEETGGVGVGTSKFESPVSAKVPVKGSDVFFDQNTAKGPNKGFYTITIDEVAPGTRDQNGVEVKPGDRVRFPAGKYDPAINQDSKSPEFLLPTKSGKPFFEVVENKPPAERVSMTEQRLAELRSRMPTPQEAAERRAFWEQKNKQYREMVTKLEALEKDATSVGTYGERVAFLEKINAVRVEAGYPEIDLAALQKAVQKNRNLNIVNPLLALATETKNQQIAEQLGHQKLMEKTEHQVGVQENVVSIAKDKKHPLNAEMSRIMDLYNGLATDTGNRAKIASDGTFWDVVEELLNKSPKNLAERVQGRIAKLATGEGLKKPEQEKPLHIPVFEPLSKEDTVIVQMVGTKALEWLNETTHTEENMRELKVFKDLLLEGNFEPTPDDVVAKAQENGFVAEGSKLEGTEFIDQYKKLGLFDQLNKIREEAYRQNARPSAAPRQQIPDIVPALRINGQLVRGNLSETHQDVLNRYMEANPDNVDALVNFDTKDNPNFFVDQVGNEISREQLQQRYGVRDSQGLRRLRGSAAPRVYGPKPAPRDKRVKPIPEGQRWDKGWNVGLRMLQGGIFTDEGGKVTGLGNRPLRPGQETAMSVNEFIQRTLASPSLVPLWKQHYPEAFEGDTVNPTALVKGLKERPLTEVMKAGAVNKTGSENRSYNDIEHDLSNLGYRFEEGEGGEGFRVFTKDKKLIGETRWTLPADELRFHLTDEAYHLSPQERTLFKELENLNEGEEMGLSYSPHYAISTNPRGGTEIAVVAKGAQGETLPADAHHNVPGLLGTATVEEKTLGELRATMGADHPKLKRFEGKPDDAVIGVQTEAQSDWEGDVREYKQRADAIEASLKQDEVTAVVQHDGKEVKEYRWKYFTDQPDRGVFSVLAKTREEALGKAMGLRGVENVEHPLLPYWERLVADAVIQHGLERGWEGVVVTDAKTAAMTEGHDVADIRYWNATKEKVAAMAKELGLKPDLSDRANGIFYEDKQGHVSLRFQDGKVWLGSYGKENPQTEQLLTKNFGEFVRQMPEQFPGHAQHYGDPDFRIGSEETPGSLQQEFAKATGEENTLRKGGENVLAVGVHKGAVKEAPFSANERQPFQAVDQTTGQVKYFMTSEAAREWVAKTDTIHKWKVEPNPDMENVGQPVGSPSLTEPHPITGEVGPKVFATGNFYSFDNVRERGNAVLPSKSPTQQTPSKPYSSPTLSGQEITKALSTDGHGLIAHLRNSVSPLTKSIADDLLKNFPNALSLVKSSVTDSGGSIAYRGEGRDVHIEFGPDMLTAASWARENVVLHELIHGLTLHEIEGMTADNPHNKALTKIREKLVSALPKQLKEKYDSAVKSNWQDRWLDATTEEQKDQLDAELGNTESDRQILYALLNNQEMTAQAFTSHSFRNYMQSVPGVQGERTAFKAFAGWIKQLLHLDERIAQTSFEEFMEANNQLMARGEYFAKLQDYGQKYYESQGKDPSYGKAQTERALGLVAESGEGITREQLVQSLGKGEHELNPALTKAREEVIAETEGDEFFTNLMAETGSKNLDDFVETAVAEGRDVSEALDMLPPASARYLYEKMRDHKDVLELLKEATRKDGIVNIAEPKKLRKPVLATLKEIDRVLKQEQEQQEIAKELMGLDKMEPGEFVRRSASPRPQAPATEKEPSSNLLERSTSAIAHAFEPLPQFMQRQGPFAKQVGSLMLQLKANATKAARSALLPFGMDLSQPGLDAFTKESIKKSDRAFSDLKLSKAVDRIIAADQMLGDKDKVTALPENHPAVAAELAKLTPEEREIVLDQRAKVGVTNQLFQRQQLDFMKQIVEHDGAYVLNANRGGTTKENLKLSQDLFDGMIKTQDPMTQLTGQQAIASVRDQMRDNPEAFLALMQFHENQLKQYLDTEQYYKENPNWASGAVGEQYKFSYFKNGKRKQGQASSEKEMKEIIKKDGGTFEKMEDLWKGRDDEWIGYSGLSPERVERWKQLEENEINMLKAAGATEEVLAAKRKYTALGQAVIESTAGRGLPGFDTPTRRLGQGAEDRPWVWNHIKYIQRSANYWSRQLLRSQMNLYLRDPEMTQVPEVRDRLQQHFQNLMVPDTKIGQQATKLAATWFLGLPNVAFNILNGIQPIQTHLPQLIAITGSPLQSFRTLKNAWKEAARLRVGEKYADPEVEKFMRESAHNSQRGLNKWDDSELEQETITTNHLRQMMKNKPQSLGQQLGNFANMYSRASMVLVRAGENLNNDVALLAAFNTYRNMTNPETGKRYTYEEAKNASWQFNSAVNFTGGRSARPAGLYSSKSPTLRTAAMIGSSLQGYVLGTTAMLGRYIQHGFFDPKGVTPAEKYAARKALAVMLGTQFSAAGLLGMPFASAAVALLNQLFPDWELPEKIRGGVDSFLGSDKENGGALTDIAMTGIPSMLGWDVQGRLSMGNSLPGVNEINGFQPENLLGPVGNIVSKFVTGGAQMFQGDMKGLENFVPPSVKKVIEAGRATIGGEGIRDYGGRPLGDVTTGENLGQFLGFQPKRLSDQNAAARIAKQSDEVSGRRLAQERQSLAEEVLKGNFGSVRQKLLQSAGSDKTRDPVADVRAIARAAEELTFPRDLRREGSRSTARGAFLNSYSNLTSQPSEVERLKFRQEVARRLGLTATSSREQTEAQMMDQLKRQKPDATRSELRAAVQLALRRSGVRQLSEVEE